MLSEIPLVDIPWSEKQFGAIWRGALTGMKRNGFRVVQKYDSQSKESLCLQIQRCRLVYLYANSTTVNASLVDVMAPQPNTMLDGPVVPEVLDGIPLFGPRLTYGDMLQYKMIIMMEGTTRYPSSDHSPQVW